MSFGPSFHDNQPITWWKRVPIYATTLLTGLLVIGMIATVILTSAGVPLGILAFSGPLFSRGALWQVFTFPFLDLPSFFTIFGFLCFFTWAVEVEKYLGRACFFRLIAGIVLGQAIACLLWWWIAGVPASAAGSYHLTAALLIAFATLYPNIEYLFGWVPLKWFAFASIVLGSLMYLPRHQWTDLTLLWVSCGIAFGYVRWRQLGGEISLPSFRAPTLRRKPKLRVLPDPEPDADEVEDDDSMAEVDALLEKIARSGIASLTTKERGKLERAREELLRRETPRR